MVSLPWPDHRVRNSKSQWQQVNIAFPSWHHAETTVLADLAPHLSAAETDGLIGAWFFVRKRPCWRVRYLPAEDSVRRHKRGSSATSTR
jgi:thiopeptide-type bacteriocin biosynthesis protein